MPKIMSETKTGRLSISVTGSIMERLQKLSDVLGQPPSVIASICLGIGLKTLEAQILGADPRLMAEAAVAYQAKIGAQPLSQREMMSDIVQGFASLSPEQLAKIGLGPEQLDRLKSQASEQQ